MRKNCAATWCCWKRVEEDLAGNRPRPSTWGAGIDEATDAIERVESRFLDLSLAFGDTLSEEQLSEFMQGQWEEQEEFEEKIPDPQRRGISRGKASST